MAPNQQLTGRIAELHSRITRGDSAVFLPTAAVFLNVTRDRFERMRTNGTNDPEFDIRPFYDEWHEAVHMMQLVTAPMACLYACRFADLARAAAALAESPPHAGPSLAHLRDDYRELCMAIESSGGSYSPWEVIETHAVTQGLLWTTGGDSAGLGDLARNLYGENSPYLRVLKDASDAFGDEVAVELLPRFCTLALQRADPGRALADLIAVTRQSNTAPRALQLTPIELCQWTHTAPVAVAKSLRERGDLNGNPWFRMLDSYLDAFEQTRSVEGRLALMMSKTGEGPASIFLPTCTVFRDGKVVTRRMTGSDHDRDHFLSHWADTTARLCDGLDFLADRT